VSYKQCIFGVPVEAASEAQVLARVGAAMRDLAGELELPDIVVAIDDDARAREIGVRCFIIGARPPRARQLTREPVYERLAYGEDEWPVVTLLHDDQHGIYFFKWFDPEATPRVVKLLSDGPLLGGQVDRVEREFAQKGFSNAELLALLEKPEAALSERERRAVMEYANAVSLGIGQFFPRWKGSYLDLLYAKSLWCVYPVGRPVRVEGDGAWANVVSPFPEDSDWRQAGLAQRDY